MENKKGNNITEQTILNEISGKNTAIHAYDKIIWQVRTGFLTLVFGGWAFIIKGAIESGKSIIDIREFLYMMIIISIILDFAGFFIDRNYVRRKFRVVISLTKLQEILVQDELAINNLSDSKRMEIIPHIGIVGDSGNKDYVGKGYNQEIFVSYLIYSTVILGCLGLFVYII